MVVLVVVEAEVNTNPVVKPNKATLVVRLDMDTMAVMVPMQIKAAAVVLEPLVVTMAGLADNILL